MTELPPRQRLIQIVRSLGNRLPAQLAPLIEHTRFADGRAALARIRDDAHLEAAAAALAETEAAWLADVLLARWSVLATPVLDPIAAILAPPEVWVGVEPVRVALSVAVVGAEPGWEVVWDGATATTGPAAFAIADPNGAALACRAHVRARTAEGRVALTAAVRIAVRRAVVTVRDDRKRIVVADHLGAPAVGVTLMIGDASYVTGSGGLVELTTAAPASAVMRVQGIPAGRIPG